MSSLRLALKQSLEESVHIQQQELERRRHAEEESRKRKRAAREAKRRAKAASKEGTDTIDALQSDGENILQGCVEREESRGRKMRRKRRRHMMSTDGENSSENRWNDDESEGTSHQSGGSFSLDDAGSKNSDTTNIVHRLGDDESDLGEEGSVGSIGSGVSHSSEENELQLEDMNEPEGDEDEDKDDEDEDKEDEDEDKEDDELTKHCLSASDHSECSSSMNMRRHNKVKAERLEKEEYLSSSGEGHQERKAKKNKKDHTEEVELESNNVKSNKTKKKKRKPGVVPPPAANILRWVRSMPETRQRRSIALWHRVKVRFDMAASSKKSGLKKRKIRWYGGVVTEVVAEGRKIRIKYDDGTSEVASFPDRDIIVDDEENGRHKTSADAFIPPPGEPFTEGIMSIQLADTQSLPCDTQSQHESQTKDKKSSKKYFYDEDGKRMKKRKRKKVRKMHEHEVSFLPNNEKTDGVCAQDEIVQSVPCQKTLNSTAFELGREGNREKMVSCNNLSEREELRPACLISQSDNTERIDDANNCCVATSEAPNASLSSTVSLTGSISSSPSSESSRSAQSSSVTSKVSEEDVGISSQCNVFNKKSGLPKINVKLSSQSHQHITVSCFSSAEKKASTLQSNEDEKIFSGSICVSDDFSKASTTRRESPVSKDTDLLVPNSISTFETKTVKKGTLVSHLSSLPREKSAPNLTIKIIPPKSKTKVVSDPDHSLSSASSKKHSSPTHIRLQIQQSSSSMLKIIDDAKNQLSVKGSDKFSCSHVSESKGPCSRSVLEVPKPVNAIDKLNPSMQQANASLSSSSIVKKKGRIAASDEKIDNKVMKEFNSFSEHKISQKEKVSCPLSEISHHSAFDRPPARKTLDVVESPDVSSENKKNLTFDKHIKTDSNVFVGNNNIQPTSSSVSYNLLRKKKDDSSNPSCVKTHSSEPCVNKKQLSLHDENSLLQQNTKDIKADMEIEKVSKSNDSSSRKRSTPDSLSEDKDISTCKENNLSRDDSKNSLTTSAGVKQIKSLLARSNKYKNDAKHTKHIRKGKKDASCEPTSLDGDSDNDEVGNNEHWVQCDRCMKWRLLPDSVQMDDLPDHWYCEMNIYDLKRNNCDAVEQTPDEIAKEDDPRKVRKASSDTSPKSSSSSSKCQPSEQPKDELPQKENLFENKPKSLKLDKNLCTEDASTVVRQENDDFGSESGEPLLVTNPNISVSSALQLSIQQPKKLGGKKNRGVDQYASNSGDGQNSDMNKSKNKSRKQKNRDVDKSTKLNKSNSKVSKEKAENQQQWVQCEKCEKWRRLPLHISPEDLPDVWDCTMNTWDVNSSFCGATEDKVESAERGKRILGTGTAVKAESKGKLSYRNLIFGSGKKQARPLSEKARAAESLFVATTSDDICDNGPKVMYASSSSFVPRGLTHGQRTNEDIQGGLSLLALMSTSRLWNDLRGNNRSSGDVFENNCQTGFSHDNLDRVTSCDLNTQNIPASAKPLIHYALGRKTLACHEVLLEVQCRHWGDDAKAEWSELRACCTFEIVENALTELVKDGLVEVIDACQPGETGIDPSLVRYRQTAQDVPNIHNSTRYIKLAKPWKVVNAKHCRWSNSDECEELLLRAQRRYDMLK